MTTYTITQDEHSSLKEMLAYGQIDTALEYLRNLKPNTQEPALYQSRLRHAWRDDADWLAWETCSKESAEDYERTPLLHDWQYQVRRLYAEQAIGEAIAAQKEQI